MDELKSSLITELNDKCQPGIDMVFYIEVPDEEDLVRHGVEIHAMPWGWYDGYRNSGGTWVYVSFLDALAEINEL